MLPATVTLSEVFLPFRDRSESEVAQRAVKLLAELRAGADFFKTVAENTPAARYSYGKRGSLGTFRLDELKDSLAIDLGKVNPGESTILQLDSGYQIIRLDARMPATPRSFEDPTTQAAVSRAITTYRAAGIRKSYIAGLREKAMIEVCPVR
jgi:PPIC-type PPIASE domain